MNQQLLQPKFALGQIIATAAALKAIEESGQSPDFFLDKHVQREWGSLCRKDRQANDEAPRMLSAYKTRNGCWIWIITEANRSSTAILLPSEY